MPIVTFVAGQVLTAAEMTQIGGDSGWISVTYQNSFATFNSFAQYRKIGNRVTLSGGAQSGSSNTAAFTLPSGFRPATQQNFSCANGNTAFGSTIVDVGTSGVVVIKDATYGVDLGSISFLVD